MNAYSYTDIGGRSHNEDAVCIRQTGKINFLPYLRMDWADTAAER